MRLVVLGGSGSSTPELADALAGWPAGLDRRPRLEVVLVGRSAAKAALVAGEFRARAGTAGPSLAVAAETDRARALDGADVVLNQVRVGGLDARAFDETFPRAFGLPGEETMGPGGFANALRTVPAQAATWDDVASRAPDALVVNLTNPAGIVQAAAQQAWPGLRIVSVCDAPVTFCRAIAGRRRPYSGVLARYVGMNHCGWFVPEDRADLERVGDLLVGMDPAVLDAHEALPTPYLRYYVEPERQLAGQRGRDSRAAELKDIDAALLAAYAAGPGGARRIRGAAWYALIVVPLLDAWLHGADEPIVLGVRNDGRLPEVPAGAMIEIAHRVRPGRLEPLEPPTRPALPGLTLARHGAYEALAAAATRPDAPRIERLRALLANPMVTGLSQAMGLLAEIEARSPRG